MSRFYFFIWLQWAVKVTFYTFVLAFVMATVITLGIYIVQGMRPLDSAISMALFAIFEFWFILSWSFALLLILFRSVKYIFNRCIGGYKFVLLACPKEDEQEQTREIIADIGYGDLLRVWRKWFMLLIWIVAAQMILALVVMKLFSSYENIFDWFTIYLLYVFIIVAGYFSFITLHVRCKKVRIIKC